MNERTSEIRAMQDRVRSQLGGVEFASKQAIAKAMGIGRNEAQRLFCRLRGIGGKVLVSEAVEAAFTAVKPPSKRCG